MSNRVLYLITCATPAATRVHELVTLAQADGWDVCVIATPSALKFLDVTALRDLTGHPVRSEYKHPDEPDALPTATAMIAAGASLNTLSKWALGIPDTLALGLLTEAIGLGLPLVAVPFLNRAQGGHPAFAERVRTLRDAGVRVLFVRDVLPEPGHGAGLLDELPWRAALTLLA